MSVTLTMTDEEARKAARLALRRGDPYPQIEDDAKVARLDDPDAEYVAVEAWIYLPVEKDGDE